MSKSSFPNIRQISYEGPRSKNPLAFKHYNADEIVAGKTMRDHLRFAVVYWHTFRGTGSDPFGPGTALRPWDDGSNSVANAQKRVRVAFEFIQKLGAPYYCWHDRDVAPEGKSLAETNKNFDAVAKVLKEEQQRTGIKLLWGTANAFSNPRYMHGAGTSCNADVFAFAAAQIKKAMEVTHELGGEGYTFWGGREGYMTLLNTDMKRELNHLAKLLHMAVESRTGCITTWRIPAFPSRPGTSWPTTGGWPTRPMPADWRSHSRTTSSRPTAWWPISISRSTSSATNSASVTSTDRKSVV